MLAVFGLLGIFTYLNNCAWLGPPAGGRPLLLAHRGLPQTFDLDGVEADTCTARRIHLPEHRYLENTLLSMQAAFTAGADIVELDIHPTTDGQFAVFHDWTLDCRTDGTGNTRDRSMAELKKFDIGYGYTADGGKTFPFRGVGVGQMPSLDEVLAAFSDRRFLIHIKSGQSSDGEKLAARLALLPPAHLARIMVYGGARPVAAVRDRLNVPTMTGASEKRCLALYIAIGWTGYVPNACANSLILVPTNVAPWLWGWPHRLLDRMRRNGTEVFVLGPWDGGDFSRGVDTMKQFRALPTGFSGGIWTNRIDLIAPLIRAP